MPPDALICRATTILAPPDPRNTMQFPCCSDIEHQDTQTPNAVNRPGPYCPAAFLRYHDHKLMTKALVKWLLLPLGGVLAVLDAGSLIESLELGDPYAWLVNTGWTTWLGFALLLLGGLLLLLFRVRPEYGEWFIYVPFVRMWKKMHAGGHRSGTVRFRGAEWEVRLNDDLLKENPDLEVRLSRPDDAGPGRDARRVKRLVLKGHGLYLKELVRLRQQ
jgi:hypothetical protein